MKLAWLGRLMLPVIVFFTVLSGFALAQEVTTPETTITIPYGTWIDVLLLKLADPTSVVWSIVGIAFAWVLARLPGPVQALIKMFRVEQLLTKAVAAGINSTRGAVAGKSLSVDVGSEVLAKAANYALDHGNRAILEWMGGAVGVQEKLLARIPLDASADGGTVLAKANSPETPQKVTDPA